MNPVKCRVSGAPLDEDGNPLEFQLIPGVCEMKMTQASLTESPFGDTEMDLTLELEMCDISEDTIQTLAAIFGVDMPE